jgi:hypothetical protein
MLVDLVAPSLLRPLRIPDPSPPWRLYARWMLLRPQAGTPHRRAGVFVKLSNGTVEQRGVCGEDQRNFGERVLSEYGFMLVF